MGGGASTTFARATRLDSRSEFRFEMRFEPVRERLLGDPVTGVLGLLELLSTLRVLKSRPNSEPILDEAREPARGESSEDGDEGCRSLERIDETRLLPGRMLGGLFEFLP